MILVTGGSGYLGSHLVKKLLERYDDTKIRTVSRSEYGIQRLNWLNNSSRLKTIIGDIKDTNTAEFILKGVDTVIHLAALKHIDLCENNPIDAVATNVNGTINILKYFKGHTFLGISTDKAIEPSGCYGATKLLQEKLVLGYAKTEIDKRFMIVRSGNIMASSGSVIDRWISQLKQNNEILITNLRMTRYFIDVDALADFIIDIIENGKSGCVYIPKQRGVILSDLVKAFIEVWGNKDTKIKEIGLREGEKLDEILYSPNESIVTEMENRSSQYVDKMNIDEIKQLLIKAKECM
jgi:FlaA1/EpsC-like NDP-sugar epimerase